MLQMFKVGATAGSLFICNQVVNRNDVNGNTEEGGFHPVSPCVRELNSRDVCQNIYPNGRYADLVHEVGMAEGVRRYPIMLQWSAEFYKSFKKPYRIVRRVVDPHVKVFRVSRLGVLHDRIAAHNQVLNLIIV